MLEGLALVSVESHSSVGGVSPQLVSVESHSSVGGVSPGICWKLAVPVLCRWHPWPCTPGEIDHGLRCLEYGHYHDHDYNSQRDVTMWWHAATQLTWTCWSCHHGSWAAFSIETFANILQNFLSLVHDCCGTFANCFDTERSLCAQLAGRLPDTEIATSTCTIRTADSVNGSTCLVLGHLVLQGDKKALKCVGQLQYQRVKLLPSWHEKQEPVSHWEEAYMGHTKVPIQALAS